jgi:hypothetical protein
MRNKKFLAAAIIVTVLLLVSIVAVLFLLGRGEEETMVEDQFPTAGTIPEGGAPLVDTEMERNYWADGVNKEGGALPMLRALSTGPVAGDVPITRALTGYEAREYVRYVDRTSGRIFDTALTAVEEPVTKSGETMLRIGRVYWSPNGTTTLLQRLDATGVDVYSYLGTFTVPNASTTPVDTTEETFSGRHLEYGDVLTAAISPDARTIFYVARTESGSVGYLESIASETRSPVWTSPLTNLTAAWGGNDTVVIYTNPSAVAPGVVWLLDAKKGTSDVVVAGERALAARMNPSGTKLLYSFEEEGSGLPSLRVLDVASGDVVTLPSGTASLAEKCVWDSVRDDVVYCAVPRNIQTKGYLEDWQYGLRASEVVVWQTRITTGEARQVLDPVELTTDQFDIIDLQVSPFGDYLVFRTKQNDILWAAQIPADLTPQAEPAPSASSTPSL